MNEKPDYELAANKAHTLFDSLKISTTISEPMAGVEEEWPHIRYSLVFERAGKFVTTDYKLGVGHVDWMKHYSVLIIPIRFESIFLTLKEKPYAELTDKMLHAQAATWLAKKQNIQPKACEVLARICNDSFVANQETFENWAAEYGFESDSRKAETIYHKCREPYAGLVVMIGIENVRKFSELAARF